MRGELPLDIERILQHCADLAYARGHVPTPVLEQLAEDVSINRAMWLGITPTEVETHARYLGVPADDAASIAQLVRDGQSGAIPAPRAESGGFSHCVCD